MADLASPPAAIRYPLGEWSSLQVRLRWVYEGLAAPYSTYDLPEQQSPTFSAWLLLAGTAEVSDQSRTLTAQTGEWLLPMLPPRRQRFSPGARILSITLHISWPSGEPLFPHDYGFVFPARKYPRLEQATRRLLGAIRPRPRDLWEFVQHSATLAAYLRVQRHLPEWLKTFVSIVEGFGCTPDRRGPTDERLIRALHLLDTLPATTAHPRRTVAEAAGLSPSQLDRLFITHFGRTPRAYIDRRKLATACSALESSRSSIKEIAYRLGFRQPAHFTTWFRQQQRESPSDYRAARLGQLA